MAYEVPGFSFTLPAGVDLSNSEFTFVDCDSNGLANVPSAGGRVVGSCQNKPKLGEACTIIKQGIVQIIASAAIPVGSTLMTTAAGQAAVLTSTNVKVGVALEAASAAGVIIAVLLADN